MSSIELGMYQGPRISQQLNLAPQLLQWLRLLQVPSTELSTLVQAELEANPALEIDEGFDVEPDFAMPDEAPGEDPCDACDGLEDGQLDARFEALAEIDDEWREDFVQTQKAQKASNDDDQQRHQYIMDSITASDSLQEHLLKQLTITDLQGRDIELAEVFIGSLDARGYLTVSLDEVSEMMACTKDEAIMVLGVVQQLDPPGVAARDLRECLLLQLSEEKKDHRLAIRIVAEYLDWVGRNELDALADALHVTREEIDTALKLVRTLNPEPGLRFQAQPVEYITPDVFITREEDGSYRVELNEDNLPRLRISPLCRQLMNRKNKINARDLTYLRRKFRRATFLIQGITQRQDTLRKVTLEMMRVQRDFFDSDEGVMKPLTMGKVAGIIGVHETTVSRALANKYVMTPRGLFELKHFFRSGYRCSDGSALTPESVKEVIERMIADENEKKPLTDLQIAQLLREEKGLKLARRTVAKYRDELGIPASKVRAA
jgi:RNA polymerase sigma-54 factor